MKECDWNATEVAAALGFSNATVTRLLALVSLPDAIRLMVERGEVSASAAYELARVQDAKRQAELAGKVAGGQLTRDAIGGAARARPKPPANKLTAPSRVTAKLSPGRSVTVTEANLTLEIFSEILEELLVRARQARAKGLSLDTFLKVVGDSSAK
jgi:hypothetical protein